VSTEASRLGIHQITMPIPFPLAQVHAYLIETGDGWAMVDAGFPSEEALAVMQGEIERIAGGLSEFATFSSATIIRTIPASPGGSSGRARRS